MRFPLHDRSYQIIGAGVRVFRLEQIEAATSKKRHNSMLDDETLNPLIRAATSSPKL